MVKYKGKKATTTAATPKRNGQTSFSFCHRNLPLQGMTYRGVSQAQSHCNFLINRPLPDSHTQFIWIHILKCSATKKQNSLRNLPNRGEIYALALLELHKKKVSAKLSKRSKEYGYNFPIKNSYEKLSIKTHSFLFEPETREKWTVI